MSDLDVLERFLRLPISDSEEVFEAFRGLPGFVEGRGEGKQGYLFVPGTREDRCVLVAHADTYFDMAYKDEEFTNDIVIADGAVRGTSEVASIGADDRAGCAILWLLKDMGHSLLILDGEEHGQVGAHFLEESDPELFELLNDHTFMIEFDRQGSSDYKCYNLPVSRKFISFIESGTGFECVTGKGRTDIGVLCTKICGVNVSVGYYNEHKPDEKVVISEWQHTVDIMREMLAKPLKRYQLMPVAERPIKAVKFNGPAKEDEIYELGSYIADESLLKLYRFTSGCTVVNSNGEIHIYSASELLERLKDRRAFIGAVPVGSIKDVGDLYLGTSGEILLYGSDDPHKIKARWGSVEELLCIVFEE